MTDNNSDSIGNGIGARPTDQATRASHEAPAGLHHSAGILRALIERCEKASGDSFDLNHEIALAVGCASEPFTASIDAALTLLPPGADWRRLTSKSASTYAANPYNTQAQKRHDGFGATVPLQICSAALKVRLEPILKALATEARRAETALGSACEGAGPKDNAHE